MTSWLNPSWQRPCICGTLLLASGCEVLAGLRGDREYAPPERAGSLGGRGSSDTASQGGALHTRTLAGDATAGHTTKTSSFAGAAGDTAGASAPDVRGGNAGSDNGRNQGGATVGTIDPLGRAGHATGTAGMTTAFGTANAGMSTGGNWPFMPPQSCSKAANNLCDPVNPCETIPLEGGEFAMGRSDSGSDASIGGDDEERPEHRVVVTPYWLDKYEVTVSRFRQFVEQYDGRKPPQGQGAHPNIPASGWQSIWNERLPSNGNALKASLLARDQKCNENFRTWTEGRGNNECLPINCIDWYLAFAFCLWDAARLPTEAEWEFAAAGGKDNRLFPWGPAPPDNTLAVFQCTATGTEDCTTADIRRIGSVSPKGDGLFGHADLAGSMWERTRDVYDPRFYGLARASGVDVANLADDATAIDSPTRGGAYLLAGDALRAVMRSNVYRSSRYDAIGFRCARNP